MARRRLMHALNDALVEEMERDERVILFGEDVEISMFGDTKGLRERFGPRRVRDTPISEGILTGMAVGAAAAGQRVVVHMFMANFLSTGFDGIANQAAKLRFMTGGQVRLPITFMVLYGGGRALGAQHADTPFPMLVNLGGINVVAPTNAADTKGLLKTAIRGDNPTVFFEPGGRGGEFGEVPDGDHLVPFGRAAIVRGGGDATVVAVGSMMKPALQAADVLERTYGVAVDLIDPRTLVPLDEDAILASVARTGRLVVVDESRDRCSFASHVAAVVGDRGFASLRAPMKRVTVPNVALPYAPPAEKPLIPNPERIVAAVLETLGRAPLATP
ncbi:MAG: alpha-ketoacid dehydrogenase subunit beta [Pseudomonadota bacterium]